MPRAARAPRARPVGTCEHRRRATAPPILRASLLHEDGEQVALLDLREIPRREIRAQQQAREHRGRVGFRPAAVQHDGARMESRAQVLRGASSCRSKRVRRARGPAPGEKAGSGPPVGRPRAKFRPPLVARTLSRERPVSAFLPSAVFLLFTNSYRGLVMFLLRLARSLCHHECYVNGWITGVFRACGATATRSIAQR